MKPDFSKTNSSKITATRSKARDSLPTVVIVGRPNVGKSTLFNRLIGSKKALVFDTPGVTRDRLYGKIGGSSFDYHLIDTGGLQEKIEDVLSEHIQTQVGLALEEADLLLHVVDGRAGLSPLDQSVSRKLRRLGKRVILVVNKMDAEGILEKSPVDEFYRIYHEVLIPVSAEHGRGSQGLLEEIEKELKALGFPEKNENDEQESSDFDEASIDGEEVLEDEGPTIGRVAIMGKPNVGKSTLLNRLIGQERASTSPMAGTTTDPIEVDWQTKAGWIRLVDTAGMRRKARVDKGVEKLSVVQAIKTMEQVDLVGLVVDASEGITDQDKKLAGLIADFGKSCLIIINKWDVVDRADKEELARRNYRESVKKVLPFLPYLEVRFTSALYGKNLNGLGGQIVSLLKERKKSVQTADVNRLIKYVTSKSPPKPLGRTRMQGALRISYGTQVKKSPPTFLLFTNKPEAIPQAYRKFLMRSFREAFGFKGSPIQVVFKKK